MALDLTNSIEWDNCNALHMHEEDRSEVNVSNDTICSKDESRTGEPPVSSSLSATPSVTLSVKSNHSKAKNKLSLTSFLKKSNKKTSSVATTPATTSPQKNAVNEVLKHLWI